MFGLELLSSTFRVADNPMDHEGDTPARVLSGWLWALAAVGRAEFVLLMVCELRFNRA